MPLSRSVLRYRLSARRLAPAPPPAASLRNEQKHRGLRPVPASSGGAPARKLSPHLRPAAHPKFVGSPSASGAFGEASRPPILRGPPRCRSPALIRRAAWEVKGKGVSPHAWRPVVACAVQSCILLEASNSRTSTNPLGAASRLFESGMLFQPRIKPAQCAFSERERGVSGVFDLRYRSHPDSGHDSELCAVELPVRKLLRQENERGRCGRGAEAVFCGNFGFSGMGCHQFGSWFCRLRLDRFPFR